MIVFLLVVWALESTRNFPKALEVRLALLCASLAWMAWEAGRPPMDLTSITFVLLAMIELDEAAHRVPGWTERVGHRLGNRLHRRSSSQ